MKKATINFKKIKESEATKITKAISDKLGKSEAKPGVDLVGLTKNLAQRHIEKMKNVNEDNK